MNYSFSSRRWAPEILNHWNCHWSLKLFQHLEYAISVESDQSIKLKPFFSFLFYFFYLPSRSWQAVVTEKFWRDFFFKERKMKAIPKFRKAISIGSDSICIASLRTIIWPEQVSRFHISFNWLEIIQLNQMIVIWLNKNIQ